MIEWEEIGGRLWLADVDGIFRLAVEKRSDGTYTAKVFGRDTDTPIERHNGINFGRIAQDVAVATAHRIARDTMLSLEGKTLDEYTAATERAGRLQTVLDAAATLAGVVDEIRIDWKHGIYGAEPYERLAAALAAYDTARAALGESEVK